MNFVKYGKNRLSFEALEIIEKIEAKPCPFCGSPAMMLIHDSAPYDNVVNLYSISCVNYFNCPVAPTTTRSRDDYQDVEKAIGECLANWNNRKGEQNG